MGDLDKKSASKNKGDKVDQASADRKRRSDIDDQTGSGDGTNLLPWDADVDQFMDRLERALNAFHSSMSSTEFRALVIDYKQLSVAERRAVGNRLQKRRMPNLLRALHSGDYRAYTDGWKDEAAVVKAADSAPKEP